MLDTGRPGKTVGLRTDIDALPVQETLDNMKQPKKVISKKDGVMHACGHDGHMAMLLTSMKILVDDIDQLKGRIIFIFEEGEERGTGINGMVELLSNYKIDGIFGIHLAAFLDTGLVSMDAGPVMAGSARINMTFYGKSGHASRPDHANNPIFPAAQFINNLASAFVNQLDVTKTVTLGIGQIHAGTADNIIPAEALVGGSMRFFDNAEGQKAYDLMNNMAQHIAEAHNCTAKKNPYQYISTWPVINDEKLALLAQNGLTKVYPDALTHDVTWYAGESFYKYSEVAPTVFAFVGIKNEDEGMTADHHNEKFEIDENGLKYGVAAATQFAIDLLNE
ncbi:amidohydrolase [Fundicoccus culcitae]|uniref:Amidohydrolase n=1 Tax=Fundicoccus culcitae TaxID=2969821 RepID=A0ABY5PAB7_9LACT|nr:amidohydrolase [Fundicoccus culcitae]UUX35534.1 amidohydrolase [Fundicoccus culcitae]